MTPDELDTAIAEIVTQQLKPRRTQNSHIRKEWEKRRIWRLCTVGKSCKLGAYKQIFNDGKQHEELTGFKFCSYYGELAGIFLSSRTSRIVEYSYKKNLFGVGRTDASEFTEAKLAITVFTEKFLTTRGNVVKNLTRDNIAIKC